MTEPWKKALQRSRAYLVNNLSIKDSGVWDELCSAEIITEIQMDVVKVRQYSYSGVCRQNQYAIIIVIITLTLT